jgi:hypothetical protein
MNVDAHGLPFPEFVLSHLPPAPARVLEIGCGDRGGATPVMLSAGYDVLAVDPRAPEGPPYRQITVEQLDDPGPFAAAVAGRVLHHVDPLGPALDRVAELAPLLIVDEFAWNHIDAASQAWYEAHYREVVAAGSEPHAPASLDDWRERHSGLHEFETLRRELDLRYEAVEVEWRPYFYLWLGADLEACERAAIEAGAIRPIGVRYVGAR